MRKQHPVPVHETDDEVANRQTASLASVAITLLLLVVSLFLVRQLQAKDTIGACLNPGQVNCSLGFHDTSVHSATSDLTKTAMRSVR